MPFIPHTPDETAQMLRVIGAADIAQLFDEIPPPLRIDGLAGIPDGLPEWEVSALLAERTAGDRNPSCFLGAGAYRHHIPAAVWQLLSRGEFYSAYTPYQAEASQGTLQVLYEFQSMIAGLTALDVANASLYEGASALAEAVLMAVRANGKAGRRILLPRTLHPAYRAAVRSIVQRQGIELVEVAYDPVTGRTVLDDVDWHGVAALAVPQPNFFGVLEDVDALTGQAHDAGALVIGVVNPLALAILKPPGQWGDTGADIACGEGQPLGIPLAGGGPYLGFMACRQALVRQLPGRIAGRTVDRDGKEGFTLTLQAREQHIRRAKATSNICTNQGLLVTAATIHMSLLGPEGLEQVASASMANTRTLVEALTSIPGVTRAFEGAGFHEAVIRLPQPVAPLLERLSQCEIFGGFDLSAHHPQLGNALLVCATETKTGADIETYRRTLAELLA
ncbi:MAG TPA: aminomethyl-transferring glycine dehydrogenase subunit GcvPA [Gammaproteobacteria bacterium]|nr:aminomethyl-transferring glycine dehydrogenase subunit GcvPA [Gammaproteobacteria bacterium]MCH77648.1 aminomethyl-transferring glycine dehydrogenase subunit GcvPA [Gammaproteobacteria bacterium]